MMKKLKQFVGSVLAVSALLTASVSMAAPEIRPGLWEVKMQGGKGMMSDKDMVKMKQAMEQMKAQLANLPPEQRKMMEQHMGNAGVSVSDSGGIQICLTKEDVKRDEIPMKDNNCQQKIKERSSKRWSASISCSHPEMKGDVVATFESERAYSVTTKGTVKERGAVKPFDMTVKMVQVSDSCGAVKPRSRK